MIAALLLAAFSCLGAGVLADLAAGTSRRLLCPAPYVLALAGSAAFLAAGIEALRGIGRTYRLGSLLGIGVTSVRVDHLAALFLTLLAALGVAVSACTAAWSVRTPALPRRGVGAAFCALLAAVAEILLAGDAFSFLFSWEVLTISFYVLAGIRRREGREGPAAWLTLGIGKVSGACLLLGFLLLAGRSGSFLLASWHHVPGGGLHDAAYGLVVAGFAGKLGIVPLQGWMPLGYPAAPGPTRAAMAGIAANVGVYGMWRFLAILGRPPIWLVIAVLLLGGITAVLGIAFAGVQTRLARVVAYSSVENAGIIVTGFGVALAGAASAAPLLEAAGLLAATLHAVAHAIAKSALFTATASLEDARGTDDLERLRGMGRVLPFSGVTFAAGALSLAGLPPTIGFVSEWFVLEALMQEFRLPGLALRLAMAGAGALIALTSGLAVLAFVRVLGLVLLGRRPDDVGRGAEAGWVGRAGLGALALSCIAIAAITPLEIRVLARGLSPIVSASLVTHALSSPWVLQPTYPGFSILSPSWLLVAMPVAVLGVTAMAVALSRGRYLRVRRVPAWHSASRGVEGPASYSAFGFANPLRHVLSNVLGTRREATPLESVADVVRGRGQIRYVTRVIEPVETYLYRPLAAVLLRLAERAKRLQSGRLEAYVSYMLVALLVALAVAAGMHR